MWRFFFSQALPVRGSGGHASAGEVFAVQTGRPPQGPAVPPAARDVPLLPRKLRLLVFVLIVRFFVLFFG